MLYSNIHPDFKWQGESLSKEALLAMAQTYIHSSEIYLQDIGTFLTDWFDDNPLIEVQTSGSTGTPKKMWVKKEYMINSAQATGDFFKLPAKTKALLCLPATYIAGKLMMVRALSLGWELYSVKPQANPISARLDTYDFTAITPYQLKHALPQIEKIKKLMVGGGAVSKSLSSEIQSVSTEIYETYAMTETLTHIAARKINHLKGKEMPPFHLLKDVEVFVDDRGCLVIRAPKVSDEMIVTNDLVTLENSKEFRLIGRYDNIINSGGLKIMPEEVESRLSTVISNRFFVYGVPDEELGQKLVVFVEGNISPKQIKDWVEGIKNLQDLDRYKKPKELIVVSRFIETHSGKVKRKETVEKS